MVITERHGYVLNRMKNKIAFMSTLYDNAKSYIITYNIQQQTIPLLNCGQKCQIAFQCMYYKS